MEKHVGHDLLFLVDVLKHVRRGSLTTPRRASNIFVCACLLTTTAYRRYEEHEEFCAELDRNGVRSSFIENATFVLSFTWFFPLQPNLQGIWRLHWFKKMVLDYNLMYLTNIINLCTPDSPAYLQYLDLVSSHNGINM